MTPSENTSSEGVFLCFYALLMYRYCKNNIAKLATRVGFMHGGLQVHHAR